jgi:hypothetical protein
MKIRPVGAELFHADGHYKVKSLFAILRTVLKMTLLITIPYVTIYFSTLQTLQKIHSFIFRF